MSTIRKYIQSQLLEPFKKYPTTIQDTFLEIITDRLEELYEYTIRFPEIVSPDSTRLDILRIIADQFQFHIREEADLLEQIAILENILSVYNKRGSIDTIENMWKYYGGDLPKEIKVNIPSTKLFRWNLSELSGTHVYPDSDTYRSGVYEISLYNSTYPIDKLKEFMLSELVAAGNRIYFKNNLYSTLIGEDSAYSYEVLEDTLIKLQLKPITYRSGLTFSGNSPLSKNSNLSVWSGRPDLFFELTILLELEGIQLSDYKLYEGISVTHVKPEYVLYDILADLKLTKKFSMQRTSYTPESSIIYLERYLYDINGDLLTSSYPGYFILGESLLGEEVL